MKLPYGVEEDIQRLPANFTSQIVIECRKGGVPRRDILDRRTAPAASVAASPDRR